MSPFCCSSRKVPNICRRQFAYVPSAPALALKQGGSTLLDPSLRPAWCAMSMSSLEMDMSCRMPRSNTRPKPLMVLKSPMSSGSILVMRNRDSTEGAPGAPSALEMATCEQKGRLAV